MKLYSFDVFDTLITRRTATPRGVFRIVEQRLQDAGVNSLAKGFFENRIRAESEARKQSHSEDIQLDEIYAMLCSICNAPEEEIIAAKDLELQVEYEVSHGVPRLIELAKELIRRGHRVVLISDMYLPADFIQSLVAKADAEVASTCTLYVSGEIKKTKANGTLYQHVCSEEKVELSELTHCGDNRRSDVVNARRLGIVAEWVRDTDLKSWEKLGEDERGLFWQLTAGSARCRRLQQPSMPDCIGYSIAGPIMGAFVAWVLREAEARKMEKLFFLARDGFILKGMAHAFQRAGCGHDAEFHYVHASRQSWRLSGMIAFDDDDVRWALTSNKRTTLSAVANRLGIAWDTLANACFGKTGATLGKDAPLTASQVETIRKELTRGALREKITKSAGVQADLLEEYLNGLGVFSNHTCSLVDLGWKGTTQDALSKVLRSRERMITLVGFYFGLVPGAKKSQDSEKTSYVDSVDQGNLKSDQLHAAAMFLEALASAPHGSTISYARASDGKVVPVLDDQGTRLTEWGYDEFVSAAVQLVEDNASLLMQDASLEDACRLTDEFLKYLHSSRLDKDFAECFGAFPFTPDSDSSTVDSLGPRRSWKEGIRFVLSSAQQRAEITCWPRATALRSGGLARFCFSPSFRFLGALTQPWRMYDYLPYSVSRNIKAVLPRPIVRFLEKRIFGRAVS
ncbi:HAD family hydrolase [Planctomycetaceae bacterium SH139]